MSALALFLGLAAAPSAEPSVTPSPRVARPADPLCSLVARCGLSPLPERCDGDLARGIDGVRYDAERCEEPRDLLVRGVDPSSEIGASLFSFLGRRYRVAYDIKGEAPLSVERFEFLAASLPFAAKLATRLGRTPYSVAYLNGTTGRFQAKRSDQLDGTAEEVARDSTNRRHSFYGWGRSKVGPWRLSGSAYVDVRATALTPETSGAPPRLRYEIRVRTAPANAVLNALMRLFIFKKIVTGQIDATVRDLTGAAERFREAKLDILLADPAFDATDREKLRAFAALP